MWEKPTQWKTHSGDAERPRPDEMMCMSHLNSDLPSDFSVMSAKEFHFNSSLCELDFITWNRKNPIL